MWVQIDQLALLEWAALWLYLNHFVQTNYALGYVL